MWRVKDGKKGEGYGWGEWSGLWVGKGGELRVGNRGGLWME